MLGGVFDSAAAPQGRGQVLRVHFADKGAGFRVLDNPAMDTTSAHGRLLLNILGSIAGFERELIRSRTSEGRARAKLRGVRLDGNQSLQHIKFRRRWREGKQVRR
jgi:DNA invertase Pin-like site-specific DNA recombinase